jgi:hypothetical protein
MHRLSLSIVGISAVLALVVPAFAAESKMSGSMMSAGHGMMAAGQGSMMSHDSMAAGHDSMMPDTMMMKKDEAIVIMPNGNTMSVHAMGGPGEMAMMKTAKPMTNCMVFMMGEDGKMYMAEDSKMADGKTVCADLAAMKH